MAAQPRERQSDALEETVVWRPQRGPQHAYIECPYFDVLFGGARGGGKLSPMDSQIFTPRGFVRMRDIKVGDAISDPTTGGTTKVVEIYPQGCKKIWRLTFDDGASIEVGDDHRWAYREANRKRPKTKPSSQRAFASDHLAASGLANRWDAYKVGPTSDIRAVFEKGGGVRIPLSEPLSCTVNGRTNSGDIDGYLVGLLLGDGCHQTISMTTCDDEIRAYLVTRGFKPYSALHTDGKPRSFGVTGETRRRIDAWLRNHDLRMCRSWEKRLPDYVKTAGLEYRTEVLRGLMDTDGTADERGRAYFISTSRALAEGVQYLVRSLGGKARIRDRQTEFTHKGEKKAGRASYQVRVWHPKLSSLFGLTRKKRRANDDWNGGYELTRELVNVEYVGEKEAQCIRVDAMYGLYVGDDFIVTHNSDACLGEFALHAQDYGRGARGVFMRREMPQADSLIDRSHEIFAPLGWTFTKIDRQWTSPEGSILRFRPLEDDRDAEKYQGQNFSRVYCEELSNWPTSRAPDKMKATLRSADGVPCLFRATANPGGAGHHWVKQRYIDPAPGGMVPIQDEVGNFERMFIPARVADNRILLDNDPGYVDRLKLTGSASLVKAWLEGDWAVIEGAFFDNWSSARHVTKPFEIPKHWLRFRSVDWGSARPFAVGWFAIASDDTPLPNGMILPRGGMVQYREWYGWTGVANTGLKLTAEQVADGIAERDRADGEKPYSYSVIDPSAFAQDGGPSIAERMMTAQRSLSFQPADNARVGKLGHIVGWDLVRHRLDGEAANRPMFVVFDTCAQLIRTLPVMQHDDGKPEDLDSDSEDHACFSADTLLADGRAIGDTGALTRRSAEVVRVAFDDGSHVVCTPDHRFLTSEGEWIAADRLVNRRLSSAAPSKSSWASGITSAALTFSARACDFIALFGKATTGLFHTATTFITKTKTRATTSLATSNCSSSGAANGTPRTGVSILGRVSQSVSLSLARYAGNNLRRALSSSVARNSATKTARRLHCVAVERLNERRDVYCLATTQAYLRLANGVVASNCDMLRYSCASRPWIKPGPQAVLPLTTIKDVTMNRLWKTRPQGGRRV